MMMSRSDPHTGARASTPATIALAQAGVAFWTHQFDHEPVERGFGKIAASALGHDPERVFKTLLASADGGSTEMVVGIVPVSGQLSLKELAGAVGLKRLQMCQPAVAERVTGYVVGGISPFGQRKLLPTVIDETCELFDTIFVSGGKRGFDIEIAASDLIAVLQAIVAPIGV